MRYFSDTWKFMKIYIVQHYKAIIISGVLIYPLLLLISAVSPWFIEINTDAGDLGLRDFITMAVMAIIFIMNIVVLTGYHIRNAVGDRRVFISMPLSLSAKLSGSFFLGILWCIWNIFLYITLTYLYAAVRTGVKFYAGEGTSFNVAALVVSSILFYISVILFYKMAEKKGLFNFLLFLGIIGFADILNSFFRLLYVTISGKTSLSLGAVAGDLLFMAVVFSLLSALTAKIHMYKEG